MQIEKPFTQEIHFTNGTRQTIYDIIHIEQGTWFHIFTKDGGYYITNPEHILFVKNFGKITQKIEGMFNDNTKRFD